jgi:hypothetical protein
MRKALLILVFALIGAACGGTGSSDTQQLPATSLATTPTVAADSAGSEATEPPTTGRDAAETAPTSAGTEALDAPPSFDGPPAPEFELALANGGNFNLADEQKPVYMVFWAEW